MRESMEKFVLLPSFSIGCKSHSSVLVGTAQSKKPNKESTQHITRRKEGRKSSSSKERIKHYLSYLSFPKLNLSSGIHRLIRSIKTFPQLPFYKKEEMEIGFPTDVKHLTHIGADGTTTINGSNGWENLNALNIVPLSLKHFELAMAAQANPPSSSSSLVVRVTSDLCLK
ncbi:CRIB domain-containing protein RIC4-like [Carica papaya]|uniref:CRIB domain-containing protein RIC4-like n=1 Tax=Carica papaya TaxID=3649 RepID=UPI000B8D082C|nr:CRIB domain-containing protein RIC4-like [Carica papaya]